ncbi:MAG: hypothetical protein GY810_13015 [Aureispira sp.]|nr:hypothetical protein [Aureispira sp.]
MEIVMIVLLCVGLALVGWLFQKYTTKCPNCGSVGKSKYLSRRYVGNDTSRQRSSSGKRRSFKVYSQRFECKECGHQFSKRSRMQQR